jgi:hypothetical protein
VEVLATFLRFEIWFLLAGLMFVVAYQILTQRISTKGLLSDTQTGAPSPARVQLLVVTLIGALFYILQAVGDPTRLPEIPQELLLILTGSNAVYLGRKQ